MNIAVIPCRTGSKGIPRKNFRILAGKELWRWSYDAAEQSGMFDLIIVSSDGGLKEKGERGKYWFDNHRPPEHATDLAQLDPLLRYYAIKTDADTVTLLQPTSPLRESSDISGAFSLLSDDIDSVISVTSVGDKYWLRGQTGFIPFYNPKARKNRQDKSTNVLYYENGAIYITRSELLKDENTRIDGKIGFYEMNQMNSHQIDSEFDWTICEKVLEGK